LSRKRRAVIHKDRHDIITVVKISELGEFGLIDRIGKLLEKSAGQKPAQLITGIGDDCAVWRAKSSVQLVSADLMLENIHFTQDTTSFKELGYKALAVNLSDIAAMGGIPRYALVSLALPATTAVEDALDIYKGMLELAGRYNTAIIGGDTSSSANIMLNITISGQASSADNLLTRHSARAGDSIAVSGCLGGAAGGLRVLNDKTKPRTIAAGRLMKTFRCPIPRLELGELLVKRGVKTAIDISDGFLIDLGHILKASGLSASVEVNKIPLHPGAIELFGKEALELALHGGEDYELLFTAPPEITEKIIKDAPCPISVIGKLSGGKTGELKLLDEKGNILKTDKTGWEHFSND